MPYSMTALVDPSRSKHERVEFARQLLSKPSCCVEHNFAKPVLNELRCAGGADSLFSNPDLLADIASSFRMKCSNIEIELNFARASNMRTAMRGRAHGLSSIVAKHVGAEVKQAYLRQLAGKSGAGQAAKPQPKNQSCDSRLIAQIFQPHVS